MDGQSASDCRRLPRRALLISYLFPPTGGSGVQRAVKLARYLPLHGWDLEVLTAAHERFPWSDASLLADLPLDCRVYRVAGWEPACIARAVTSPLDRVPGLRSVRRWLEDRLYWRSIRLTARFGLDNGESLWNPVRTAVCLHRRKPYDALISTGPPHFVHRVAMRLADKTGLPWIADLRDPLVSDFDRAAASESRAASAAVLEREILAKAARIITTSPAFSGELRKRYPHANILTIPNGFDPEDISPHLWRARHADTQCTFVAAGSFYGRREIGRLVDPLATVLSAHPDWRGKVRLVIAGTIDAEQRRYWEQARPEWLEFRGYLDHRSAIALAAGAACNLVVVPDCGHGRCSIPAKTYELLALPVHILGLVPPGCDSDRFLASAGGASMAPLEDAAKAATAFERIIEDYFAGRLAYSRNQATVEAYDRRRIAAQFAKTLDHISRSSAGAEDAGFRADIRSAEVVA